MGTWGGIFLQNSDMGWENSNFAWGGDFQNVITKANGSVTTTFCVKIYKMGYMGYVFLYY